MSAKIHFPAILVINAVLSKSGDNAGRVSYVDLMDVSDGSTYNVLAEGHPFLAAVGQTVQVQANVSGRVFNRPVQGRTGAFIDKSQKLTLSNVVIAPVVAAK